MYVLYIQCILKWDFPFCNFAKCIVYTEYICVYVICMCGCSHVCSLSGVFVVIFRPYVAFLAQNWKVGWLKWRMGCL